MDRSSVNRRGWTPYAPGRLAPGARLRVRHPRPSRDPQSMPRGTQGRLLRVLLACAAVAALVPAAASGETWTVDDDGAECPSATFSRIQEAVDQAAPRDTVVICAGVYEERSTP